MKIMHLIQHLQAIIPSWDLVVTRKVLDENGNWTGEVERFAVKNIRGNSQWESMDFEI